MVGFESNEDGTVTGINVTPLVDIMLVLLIVFMVTAQFASEEGLKIQLPKSASQEAAATPALTLSITEKGKLFLLGTEVDLEGLTAHLLQEARYNPGIRITVVADQRLPYQHVVTVLDLIKKAGVTRVALATEK